MVARVGVRTGRLSVLRSHGKTFCPLQDVNPDTNSSKRMNQSLPLSATF